MNIPFVKMHGAGNDFVMLNAISHKMPEDLQAFSKAVCHRHFGVGADQVLIAYSSDQADFKMDIYNADGGHVEMCGNGIRCFAQYLQDQKLTDKNQLQIETMAGIIVPQIITDHPKNKDFLSWVKVDMGQPILEGVDIPVKASGQVIGQEWVPADTTKLLETDPKEFKITTVSMGNPHCVIFVDDVENFPVERIGSVIEQDVFFPNRVNVEFVQIVDRQNMIQRTWERGSGETYACGTGASAVAVAGVLNGLTDPQVTIKLKGGDLDLYWDQNENRVFKTGPSTTVFQGEFNYEE